MELRNQTLRLTIVLPRLKSDDAHKEGEIQAKKTKNSKLLQNTITHSHAKQITFVPMLVAIKNHFGPVWDTDLSGKSPVNGLRGCLTSLPK